MGARGAAAVAAVAVATTLAVALVACTPAPETFRLVNRTDSDVTLWWGVRSLGTVGQGSHEVDIPSAVSCLDEPLRAVTSDLRVAVLDDGPVCRDGVVVVSTDELAPAVATATVVNDTEVPQELRTITGEDRTAEPGEQVEVDLRAPRGGCVVYHLSSYPPAAVPAFWGGLLCDGDVLPLAPPTSPSVDVDNRTSRDVDVLLGTHELGRVAAGTRAAIPLAAADCVTGTLRALDPTGGWVQLLPETVCPAHAVVVDALVPTGRARFVNTTDVDVSLVMSGPALSRRSLLVPPGTTRWVDVEVPRGSCTLIDDDEPELERGVEAAWFTGYLCDGAVVTARQEPLEGGGDALVWRSGW